jgi:2-methylisocitrate lyase-like PEP mutase family enzyme
MPNDEELAELARKADTLRALHRGPGMLVLPNAWDAASARAVAAAGFPAIATTSSGVALAMGYEDGEKAPPSEMAASASRIAKAVSVPVTVDYEAGYGASPEEIARKIIEIGGVGLNFEDTDHAGPPHTLVDADIQAGRVAALKAAGRALGVDLVVNARTDVFIHRAGTPEEQAEEGLRRARLYREAGADCVYPILLTDEAVIRRFVEACEVINVNLRRGGALSLAQVAALGVCRVSYAGSIFREAITFVEQVAKDLAAEVDQLPGG